jgi:hypothetical protein
MSKKMRNPALEPLAETKITSRSKRSRNEDSAVIAISKKRATPGRKAKSPGKRRAVKNQPDPAVVTSTDMRMNLPEIVPELDVPLETQAFTLPATPSTSPEVCADSISIANHPLAYSASLGLDKPFEEEKDVVSAQDVPVLTRQRTEPSTQLSTILYWLGKAWNWMQKLGSGPTKKRLRVCETVSLGEKRFVAVIEVDGEQFLVGGASSSVVTLARLESSPQFSDVLKGRWAPEAVQA